MFKLAGNVKSVVAIDYGQLTASKTDGDIVDTQGYDDVYVQIHAHAVATADADNYFTATVNEGDESDLSDGAAVSTSPTRYFGESPSDRKIDATGQAQSVLVFGIRPMKRYIRVILTETGTADVTVSAVVLLGNPKTAPTV